jgi:hypothetical protein
VTAGKAGDANNSKMPKPRETSHCKKLSNSWIFYFLNHFFLILENPIAEKDICLHYPERIFSYFILEIFPKIQEI